MQGVPLFPQAEDRTQPIEKRHTYDSLGSRSLAGNHHCGWNGPTGSLCAHPTPMAKSKLAPASFPAGHVSRAMLSRYSLSLIHISEPTRLGMISYAVFCLKK